MRLDTTDEEMIRAGLEAVAYQFGAVYGLLRQEDRGMGELIGSGVALVHSPAWMQIMADVLGQTIAASAVAEATSRGQRSWRLRQWVAFPMFPT
jgi:gluconokinase